MNQKEIFVRKAVKMNKFKRMFIQSLYDSKYILRKIVQLPKNFLKIKSILSNRSDDSEHDYFLSVMATIKNEANYIEEWIEYHLLIGVEHFYLYDNESTDDLEQILAPYIKSGVVTYNKWQGKSQQLNIYRDGLFKYKNESLWIAILDVDEFIVGLTDENIVNFLKSLSSNVSQVMLGWMVFGSSGKKQFESNLVLDRFRMHASNDWIADSKSIVKAKKSINMPTPHWVDVVGKTINENGQRLIGYPRTDIKTALPMPKNKFRINHYYSKSWQEFEYKKSRGFADRNNLQRTMEDFLEHDQNVASDTSIDNIVNTLKKLKKTDDQL